MADDNANDADQRRHSSAGPDCAAASTAPTTRRTSVSSQGTMSRHPEQQQSSCAAAPASQGGLQPPGDNTPRRPRARPDYGSMQGSSSGGGGAASSRLTPQTTAQQTPKRPMNGARRVSTQAPHRGEVFSVDDDANEVEEDTRQQRTHPKADSHQDRDRERQLRRRESTLRWRGPPPTPSLPRVDSHDDEDEAEATATDNPAALTIRPAVTSPDAGVPASEETLQGEEDEEEETPSPDEDDSADLSDAESFTLKDRQEAINETHPFGIRIWKPALYKKSRSVQRNAEGDIHSAPGGNVSRWLWLFNGLWTLVFGWWLATITSIGGVICLAVGALQPASSGGSEYGRILINLAHYLFYPFGKYVRLERDEAYVHEDEGEGRDIAEYERWQAGDIEEGRLFFGPRDINRSLIGRRREEVPDLEENETDPLLGRGRSNSVAERARSKTKKRLFGRGQWNLGRVIFFLSFYLTITPCLFIVSAICWFLVFTIPMGKVTLLLFYHLRRHPLAMSFHTDSHYQRVSSMPRGSSDSVVLLCTYRAVGIKYWKYTIDGTNIFLINLLGLVVFAIFDYFVLYQTLHIDVWITSPGFVFVVALASIIPLAYFIGQAVASISAQSSMGVGATINAFFSTIVEVFLYCVALDEGKAQLVEGSIIGSIFAGILFLPGLSMCFGAIKRKTQRFNVKSAGVTSTMLLFAVIGCFGPTLFYQFYGSHVLNCRQCIDHPRGLEEEQDCRRCYFTQVPEINDEFFMQAVRPYVYFCTVCLFLSYVVGLLFTLRTHAAVIWNNEPEEEKKAKHLEHQSAAQHHHVSMPYTVGLVSADTYQAIGSGKKTENLGALAREDISPSQMYRRILNQSLKHAGVLPSPAAQAAQKDSQSDAATSDDRGPHIVPPKSAGDDSRSPTRVRVQGVGAEDNGALVQQVAEMATTAATTAARDATTKATRRTSVMSATAGVPGASRDASYKDLTKASQAHAHDHDLPSDPSHANHAAAHEEQGGHGGHDAPNWSRTKSAVILMTATAAYAVIAEILVDTVDVVLSSMAIPEKFLGITLFSLVPNTTEFLNAISFAMNGNVALSMEIGSSYALQVVLLQVPCLVLFTAIYGRFVAADQLLNHSFTLILPQWDMVVVLLSVFLFGWIVGEGKSNYFKGSILIFTYLVVVVGFWFTGYNSMDAMGVDRFDTLALGVKPAQFRTVGQGRSGRAVPDREL